MGLNEIHNPYSDRNSSDEDDDSPYPKSQKRYPFYAFWYENGELQAGQNPQETYIEYVKTSEHASWKRDITSHKIKKYWMNQLDWRVIVQKVQEEFDVWLPELAQDDPQKACELITQASKGESDDHSISMTEKCPVCREENHIVHGDWERVDNRRVCTNHTVTEMLDAGVID